MAVNKDYPPTIEGLKPAMLDAGHVIVDTDGGGWVHMCCGLDELEEQRGERA
jgi:hypothetical protein